MTAKTGFLGVCVTALTVCVAASSLQVTPVPSQDGLGLYDANPNHLWNRIHETFHVRVAPDGSRYGFDAVDPLLWRETRHLLTGASAARAVRVLDEFLASRGERLIADPLKRAVFQHDLWAVFDWAAYPSETEKAARIGLMGRLARVIRRVALTRKEIEALPDSYAAAVASGAFTVSDRASQPQPFLPRDLFSATGPWVSVSGRPPVAPQHAAELSRSAFIVLWNLRGGSAETVGYLQKLWDFPQPFISDESFQFFGNDGEVRARINPALPPVPDGTQIALVRQMLLIDDTGAIVPSRIVQSIQLRAFPGRSFFEWQMSRIRAFTGKAGGLRAVGADDGDFITFSSMGMDMFERGSWPRRLYLSRVLDGCINCHHVDSERAIETVRSVRQILKPSWLINSRHERWGRWFTQPVIAAEAKSRSYDWGVLVGLWQSQPR